MTDPLDDILGRYPENLDADPLPAPNVPAKRNDNGRDLRCHCGSGWIIGSCPKCDDPRAKAHGKEQAGYRPKLYTSPEFFRASFKREFLVDDVLVTRQPGVLGGPKKVLKSGAGIDLAISLDTATPFLNCFEVRRRVQVLLLNGESGEATVQETAARIAKARDIDPPALGILWGSELPQLANFEHLTDLAGILAANKVEVLILDPTYLCLLSGAGPNGPNPANLYDMGALYSLVARTCLDAGATPILAVHAKKGRERNALDLDDLAFAGVAEFARQWILLNRREPYEGDGLHKLWLNVGGSAGHSFVGHLDIDEGIMGSDFGGRKWQVTVTPYGQAKRDRKAERDRAREEQRQADELAVMGVIDRLAKAGDVPSVTRIRHSSGLSKDRTDAALDRLRQAKLIELAPSMVVTGNGARQPAMVYRRLAERNGV